MHIHQAKRMKIRYFEAWAVHVLAAQPWVRTARTFAAAGVDKPVGVAIEPQAGQPVRIQFVRASPSITIPGDWPETWDAKNAQPVEPVDAAPTSPKEWAVAVVAALTAASHPAVTAVETLDDWGKSNKPAGVRVVGRDGSEIFGTVLDRGGR